MTEEDKVTILDIWKNFGCFYVAKENLMLAIQLLVMNDVLSFILTVHNDDGYFIRKLY